jgi:hypothetical protein
VPTVKPGAIFGKEERNHRILLAEHRKQGDNIAADHHYDLVVPEK